MTNVVIQQNSRKLLMMDILMSETCWAHKKWNKIASDIKLVFYSLTIKMMHDPINIRSPWRFWRNIAVTSVKFQDNRHMKVARLSALRTGRLYNPGNLPGHHFCLRLSQPQDRSRPEGLCQWKISITKSGIEPATFRLVGRCLNELCHRHRVPQMNRKDSQ